MCRAMEQLTRYVGFGELIEQLNGQLLESDQEADYVQSHGAADQVGFRELIEQLNGQLLESDGQAD